MFNGSLVFPCSSAVGERLAALAWLIHMVCDSPSVRLLLDARVDQAANDKREIMEIGKVGAGRVLEERQPTVGEAPRRGTGVCGGVCLLAHQAQDP